MNNKLLVRTIDNAEDLISKTLSKRFEDVTEKIKELNEIYQCAPDDKRLSDWVSELGDELKYIAELLNNEMDGKHAEIRKDLQDRVLMILGYDSSQLSEDEKRQNRELAEWIIDREFNERIEGIKKSVKNTPNIRKIAENYLSEVDQYNEKQKMAIMDFVAHMESYYEVYDKVISDQKDTVDNLFAATNANILNRNNN